MAETVARRGGLAVHPAGHPDRRRRRGRRAGSRRGTWSTTPRSRSARTDDRRRRAGAAAQARARRGRRGRGRRARSASSPTATARTSTASPSCRQVMTPRPADRSRPAPTCRRSSTCSPTRAIAGRARWSTRRPAGRRAHPQGRAALHALHARRSTRGGRLRIAAAVGINGDVAGKAERAARRRRRRARRRHRARPPGEDARGAARGARPRPGRCRSSPATWSPPRAPAT